MMLGGGIPRQSLRSWIEVLPGIDARLGQVGRAGRPCAKAIRRDVLVERPPAAGDLFVLAYDEASRLYFETVLVKRKPKLLCQGQLFSLELEPEGAYPKLSEPFVKGNPVLLAGLEEVRRMQKAGTSPAELVAELEEREASTPLARLPGYGDLRERVRADPSLWTDGTGPGDAPLAEDEQALLTAGELVAFAEGLRGVAMLQVSLPADMGGDRLPLLRPFVFPLLKALHDDSKRVLILPSKVPGATSLLISAKRQPYSAWAAYLANLGVQASLVAESPFYKMIIGLMMGYKREHVEHHVRETSGRVDPGMWAAVEAELAGLGNGMPPVLPWK
jgi:hypothetical protein